MYFSALTYVCGPRAVNTSVCEKCLDTPGLAYSKTKQAPSEKILNLITSKRKCKTGSIHYLDFIVENIGNFGHWFLQNFYMKT